MRQKIQRLWIYDLLRRYTHHDVAQTGAALTYYLFFSIFPLLIFLSTLLGFLELDVAGIIAMLSRVIPHEVLNFIEYYLNYVQENQSRTLLWFSLLFSVYFPFRATNTLMRAVRRAYGVQRPKALLLYNLKVLLYTILLLVTITVGFGAAVLGRKVTGFLARYITINAFWLDLWLRLRFLLLAGLVGALITLLYGAAQDRRLPLRDILPGAAAALACWLAATVGFSYYVDHFANYSVIYGSLGVVIVLLLWLYLTAMLMIMGAEFNKLLLDRREQRQKPADQIPKQ